MLFFLLKLIISITPLYLIRLELFGIPANVLEISVYVLFLSWVATRVKNRDWSIDNFNDYFFIPIILIFLGATLSTVFSENLILSAGIWKGYFLSPFLFLIVFMDVFKRVENRKSQIENLLKWLLLSGFVAAIISFIYLFSGNLTYDGRLNAFYLSPNHLAMFLALILIVNIHFLFNISGNIYNRILLYITFFTLCVVIYFTYSLGAWVGLLVAVILYFLIRLRASGKLEYLFSRKLLFYRLIIFTITVVLLIFSLSSIADYFDATERSSIHSRIIIWKSAIRIIQDKYFLGIGPGMFQDYYLDYQKFFPPYLEWAVPQPHNIFLAFWLQSGFIGLIGFIWLLTIVFKNIIKKNRDSINDLLFLFFVYFIVHGAIDSLYWKNDLSLIFWLFIGILLIRRASKL